MVDLQVSAVTVEAILQAAEVAGFELTSDEAEAILDDVEGFLERYRSLRALPLGNDVPFAVQFDPRPPGVEIDLPQSFFRASAPAVERPANLEEAAFWPVTRLAELVRTRQVRPTELTEMYLARLRRYDPVLRAVVNLTEERALEQARRADAEIHSGRWRGPLHGIPFGVKDIVAVRGYPTTWGAGIFRERVIDQDATVVRRLEEAGAVLVAKLTTGELAFGDLWYGGRTRNPWNPEEGSSGSSAGSGAAAAAGLVGFAIGTDTGGSILSPSERSGVVGLRPTFGRVSRYGIMTAGFTLDKVGPMARSAEDCALVLHAVAGPDHHDRAVADVPVAWDADLDVRSLRLGWLAAAFEAETEDEYRRHHEELLGRLRAMGMDPVAVELPADDLNFFVEFVERAAAFDELVRQRMEDKLEHRGRADQLRAYRLVPGVEYLQANRARTLLMQEVARALGDVDVVLAPRTSGRPERSLNPLTSLTGHPVVAVPTGLAADGTPMGVTLMGRLYREGELLSVAQRILEATGFDQERPPRFP
jgi:Asp-tRNA(Asn)/Glu-tRNA(Gln) amidotransferase A subunit family amidase